MAGKTFEEILRHPPVSPVRMVVAGAADEKLLAASAQACAEGWIRPVFVGPEEKLSALLKQCAPALSNACIIPAQTEEDICTAACDAVLAGGFLMKGMLETADLMRGILHRKSQLMDSRLISHISLLQVPYYGKLFGLSDTSVLIAPTLEQKTEILRLGIAFMRALGRECPKAGVLCAVEKENPAMAETVDAARLAAMAKDGAFGACLVDGPISLDIAIDAEAARIKRYSGFVQGDADFLLAPTLAAGNLLGKCFNYTPNSLFAGFLLGTKMPVVLTSRASSYENKLLSIKTAAILSGGTQHA